MRHRQLDIRNPRYTEVEIFDCPPGCHIQGAAQNRRGWIQEHREILGVPSFSPHRSGASFRRLAHSLCDIGYRLLAICLSAPYSHGLIRRTFSPAFGAGKTFPAPANVVSRSLSTIRTGIFRCCSQKLVSAAAKVPVSNSLFAGAPPPQTSKYSQVSSH